MPDRRTVLLGRSDEQGMRWLQFATFLTVLVALTTLWSFRAGVVLAASGPLGVAAQAVDNGGLGPMTALSTGPPLGIAVELDLTAGELSLNAFVVLTLLVAGLFLGTIIHRWTTTLATDLGRRPRPVSPCEYRWLRNVAVVAGGYTVVVCLLLARPLV